MGTIQFLLLTASIITFGTWNLLMTNANITQMETQCEFTALKGLYDIGLDAHEFYDSTGTYLNFEIQTWKKSTPYAEYSDPVCSPNNTVINCTVQMSGDIFQANVSQYGYTLTKL